MRARSGIIRGAGTDEDAVPSFDSDTLSDLTQKIQVKLDRNDESSAPVSKPRGQKGQKRERKPDTNKVSQVRNAFLKNKNPIKQAGEANGRSENVGSVKSSMAPKLNEGKKRLRNGNVKEPSHQKGKGNIDSTELGPDASKSTIAGDLDLGEELRNLGGTQEDIDLIADAPSDSELEAVGPLHDDITKEVYQFVRQLGVDKVSKHVQVDSSESDSDDEGLQIYEKDGKGGKDKTKGLSRNGLDISLSTLRNKERVPLVFKPLPEWHAAKLPLLPTPSHEASVLPIGLIDRLHEHARSLLQRENEQYLAHHRAASSAHQFYSTIMSTGTLSDKISALTLSIQESPVHNMKALENLVGLASKRNRSQAIEVLGALKDLFGPGNLLPSDRKLRVFASQPALASILHSVEFHGNSKDPLPKHLQECHLVAWAYEDWLKAIYFDILKIIESWCNDEVGFARGKAVDYVYQLLKEKPEQEANLLRLLVNKLGDSEKKIASRTSFHILQLESLHPLMKSTIITAIESDLLFRPGQSLHARYYATITLNQTVLSGKEETVAKKLLDIYFSLFITILENSKPWKPAEIAVGKPIMNRNGEIQGGRVTGGKKALKKHAEKEESTAAQEELREKMLAAVLTGINRAMPFTSKNDESIERHTDTLFRVTHSSNFNTSIQALMLIQQLTDSHHGSVDRFYRTLYESLLDNRLLTSSKQALYLNLLFRALRSDLNVKRVKAFAKRLIQVVAMHQPSFTCGTLYLVRELEAVFANLKAFMDQAEEDNDSEDVEYFRDVGENSAGVESMSMSQTEAPQTGVLPHKNPRIASKYDGRKRDPEHSNADRSSFWELTPFLYHYHPSVSLFATRLITHDEMPPKPDLSLNTLIHFLDRFVYRNPKVVNATKGASIMQPMAGGDSSALLVSAYSYRDKKKEPVNSESFWKQDSEKVGADEVFFHKYFNVVGRGKEKAKKKKAGKKKDQEGSESGGDEDEIWKALVDSRPELDEGSDGGGFNEDDLGSDLDKDDELEGKADSDGSLNLEEEGDGALLDSDEEVANDVKNILDAEVMQSNGDKLTAIEAPEKGKKHSQKRRRLKNLPTFASMDDYARMLDDDSP
ncbi:RNA-binding ribosome biosynthesis protein mak21 [Lecanora helva]